MPVAISDDLADAFALALVKNAGNKTRAAIDCGYTPGPVARQSGFNLARNPRVLERLQPLVSQHLNSLTPKAVATLGKLLDHKSGYIRLEAAKDILDRNGVGTEAKPLQSQPFLIRINLGAGHVQSPSSDPSAPLEGTASSAQLRPGGRKSEPSSTTSTPGHDFPEKVNLPTPAHDFPPEVFSAGIIDVDGAAKPLEPEKVVPSKYNFDLD